MSSWNRDEDDDEQEEEDDADETEYKTKEDRIIFLIDARKEMLENKTSTGQSHLQNSLAFVVAVMKSKIISGEKCVIGVTFFGTVSSFFF